MQKPDPRKKCLYRKGELMLKDIFYFLQENILLSPAYVYFRAVAHNNHAAFPTPVFPGMIQVNKK
jgi:hypothetical protein